MKEPEQPKEIPPAKARGNSSEALERAGQVTRRPSVARAAGEKKAKADPLSRRIFRR
jgi:hypothetical protein